MYHVHKAARVDGDLSVVLRWQCAPALGVLLSLSWLLFLTTDYAFVDVVAVVSLGAVGVVVVV